MDMGWPRGRFAFSVFDDTDYSTLANTAPVYDFLAASGFRTTKSCWVRQPRSGEVGIWPGSTTADAEYLTWLLRLQQLGFEIALHNVSWATSSRTETVEGFHRFESLFGHAPETLTNHAGVGEAIYWGEHRLSGLRRVLYSWATRGRNAGRFDGHVPGSPRFWGDICQQRVKYVRNFTFSALNTLRACPLMPYRDDRRPFVAYWFASTDGHDRATFSRRIGEENQDRLEAEGGACIMYTHFGGDFAQGNALDPDFRRLMTRLARKDGWFVPVCRVLDHLRARNGHRSITDRQRVSLEWKWLVEKVFLGTT